MESLQNSDGGWPYERGHSSWTEPTVFAMLAARDREAVKRGAEWLRVRQNSDGGWSPQPNAGPSTWVTALVALLPGELLERSSRERCVKWLLNQTGEESTTVNRIRQWMLGNPDAMVGAEKGWPWYPGAAAWVMPTAVSLLALRKEQKVNRSELLTERVRGGTRYLLLHECKGGGWNHGSTHALGYEAGAYPETTGVALLALRGVKAPEVERGLARAEKFLADPNPAGAGWLRMGLIAHGRSLPVRGGRSNDVVSEALDRLGEEPNVLLV